MGGTGGDCDFANQYITHLHFDRFDSFACGDSSPYCVRDSFLGIRKAYARVGLRSDGLTINNEMAVAWLTAVGALGSSDPVVWMQFVGWPGHGSGTAGPNAVSAVSGASGASGFRQTLMTGVNVTGWRSGILTHRLGDSVGYLVNGGFYGRYSIEGGPQGWLGFPLTEGLGTVQLFEGGCIFSGTPYQAYPWGVGSCGF